MHFFSLLKLRVVSGSSLKDLTILNECPKRNSPKNVFALSWPLKNTKK